MKIKKENIMLYVAAASLGTEIALQAAISVPNFICKHTKHNEKICPITRIEMLFGTKENAIEHQLQKSEIETGKEPIYGTLKKTSFQYEAISSDISNDLEKNTYYSVNDDEECVKVNLSTLTETIGTGVLTGDNFVALNSWNDDTTNDESVYTKSKRFADEALMTVDLIDYIGPVDKDYPNSIILEDRDGNEKRVASNIIIGKSLAKYAKEVFKTFYYDAEAGYYKIDENAFREYMQNLVVTQTNYSNCVVHYDEETHRPVLVVPENGVLMDNGLVRVTEQIKPYSDFSFYTLEPRNIELENNNNVKKLTM